MYFGKYDRPRAFGLLTDTGRDRIALSGVEGSIGVIDSAGHGITVDESFDMFYLGLRP